MGDRGPESSPHTPGDTPAHPAAAGTLTFSDAAIDDTGGLVANRAPARTPASLPLRQRNRCPFLGEHARGGLGRVWRARDRELDRVVALKEMLPDDDRAAARFVREVRVTARLEHPGIVPIHEAGRWPTGEPFYV